MKYQIWDRVKSADIKYYRVTSAGPNKPTQETLSIITKGTIGRSKALSEMKIKDEEKKDFVRNIGDLYVMSTGINKSLRIDNQLRSHVGRQGGPGESKFFIGMESSLSQYFWLFAVLSG